MKDHELQEHQWAESDAASINKDELVLFVDLGANLGQGYLWFKKYFNAPNISFELFEPNPNCVEKLKEMDDVASGRVTLHPVGVGAEEGRFNFYGLNDQEGGKYSQGGSLLLVHNSKSYIASEDRAISVNIIDFSTYLKEKSATFDKIIVKMDIEGAEVELLEELIRRGTVKLISTLYVEFHSQYQSEEHSLLTKERENRILHNLLNDSNVNVRIWH